MEVHAHSHSPRKKWTHYFWEFLMLFLAVIAGFYAENIREHKVEARRGKEYLRSFHADLKADTANYAGLLDKYNQKSDGLRDFYACYLSIRSNQPYNDCLVDIYYASNAFPDLINEDRTMQQLKSSGALRLLSKEDADSITIYDAHVRRQNQSERTAVQETQSDLRNAYSELIDFEVFFSRVTSDVNAPSFNKPLIPCKTDANVRRLFMLIVRYSRFMQIQKGKIVKLTFDLKGINHFFYGRQITRVFIRLRFVGNQNRFIVNYCPKLHSLTFNLVIICRTKYYFMSRFACQSSGC